MSLKQRLANPLVRIFLFLGLAISSIFLAFNLNFSYEFEQFFPRGDKDLDFFFEFREKFEPDDNFMLVGLTREQGILDSAFLFRANSVLDKGQNIPGIKRGISVTNFKYLVKGPFGYVDYPALHIDQPSRYQKDSSRISEDPRLSGRLLSRDFKSMVLYFKTKDSLSQTESELLVDSLEQVLTEGGFDDYHLLGKANFQKVLVAMQKKEFIFSSIVSAILVTLIFFLIFRRFATVATGLISVLLTMILFLGFLGLIGAPLDIMAVIYPILMIIVGVSDVVHLTSKYQIELARGLPPPKAMRITIREIGIATFLTSLTTAIGFATLLTSKVPPVSRFGLMAAFGVLIAYVTVILFTTAILGSIKPSRIQSVQTEGNLFEPMLKRLYILSRDRSAYILTGLILVLILCGIGISRISTEVHISSGLPRGEKISEDFHFFEKELIGFRPFEIAASANNGNRIDDLEVLREIDKVETFMASFGAVSYPASVTGIYKSLEMASKGNKQSAFKLPETDIQLKKHKKLLKKVAMDDINVLSSADGKYGRISATIQDVGTDSIRQIINSIDNFIASETNPELVSFRQTGTGIIFDKNNEYIRDSLLGGLSIAFVAVSLIMAFLFRNWRMVLISLIPNVIPLLICAAAIGFLGIELDAPTSIIFAVSFGIAVDDTIHFLSRLKLELGKGFKLEEAIKRTFLETGSAILMTTVILFSGFLILLFSSTAATFNVGLLISITLFTAVFADLLLIPMLLRKFLKPDSASSNSPAKVPDQMKAVLID